MMRVSLPIALALLVTTVGCPSAEVIVYPTAVPPDEYRSAKAELTEGQLLEALASDVESDRMRAEFELMEKGAAGFDVIVTKVLIDENPAPMRLSGLRAACSIVKKIPAEIDDNRRLALLRALYPLFYNFGADVKRLVFAYLEGTGIEIPPEMCAIAIGTGDSYLMLSGLHLLSIYPRKELVDLDMLISFLEHEDVAVRRTAIQALRVLTGEYFGYVPDDLYREESDGSRRFDPEIRQARLESIAKWKALSLERRGSRPAADSTADEN
ncbi:MAG: hypothetical protein NUW37_05460 [Planctomycetes bacterium]|nr:hypothetical protein [Planctomycetota bacterium]